MRNGMLGMLTAVLVLTAFLAGIVRATLAWEQTTEDRHPAVRGRLREWLDLAA
jgi:hypothetical protein